MTGKHLASIVPAAIFASLAAKMLISGKGSDTGRWSRENAPVAFWSVFVGTCGVTILIFALAVL